MIKYRPEIDGLRAFAVLPVILFHAGVGSFAGGFVGVDIFFVISGFLITSILLSDIDKGTYSLLTFYERRARRILPALIFVILATIPFAWAILLPADLADFGRSIVASMTFLSNVYFWNEINYFNPTAEYKPLLHTWSLAVEEQFYILFPPLLVLLVRRFASWTTTLLIMIAVASFALAQLASIAEPAAAFFLLPTRIWELMIGSLVALYVFKRGLPQNTGILAAALAGAGIFLIVGSIVLLDEHLPFPGVYALPATVGTALIILFAQPGTIAHKMLAWRGFVGIGLISYSAYLWHQPLIALQRYRLPDWDTGPLVMGALSLPLAYVSWRWVEAPFRTKSVLKTRARCLSAAALSLVAASVTGLVLTLQNGWQDRFDPRAQAVFATFTHGEDYVPPRFNALLGKDFPAENDRPNVLLIGDSYGQDLVNALFEAGLDDRFNLSTHHIAGRCGNLMIDDLAQYQEPHHRVGCQKTKGYDHPPLLAKMQEADQVWLVSSWTGWSAPLLGQSLENMADATTAEVIVFGRKHLGIRALRDFYPDGLDGMLGEQAAPAHLADVQKSMATDIPPVTRYVDIQMLLCGGHETCQNADPDGNPITFDGTHLTPEGALFLGQKLQDIL